MNRFFPITLTVLPRPDQVIRRRMVIAAPDRFQAEALARSLTPDPAMAQVDERAPLAGCLSQPEAARYLEEGI
jgi:hypothetical protein